MIIDEYLALITGELPTEGVYNILITVKNQIQKLENLDPAVVISVEQACVDNAVLHDYLFSELAFQDLEICSTDPETLIDNS